MLKLLIDFVLMRGWNEPADNGNPVKVSTAVPVITTVFALMAVAGMSTSTPCTWI
ncbi:unannotated protein [freshwater metagenome]|uniref:Unannotated protein n=1 Tax=freshwater metagenome TaxID=449393 RepID=A0A6J6Y4I6_9ZZZZ